jgi:VanZ family protein
MKYKIWVAAEVLLIFILLSLPGSSFPTTAHWWHEYPVDKLVHVMLFGSLAFSIFSYFENASITALKTVRAKAIAILFCVLYGIGMEFYQKYFAPSRGFEVNDMLADAVGALFALPIFEQLQKRKHK